MAFQRRLSEMSAREEKVQRAGEIFLVPSNALYPGKLTVPGSTNYAPTSPNMSTT